MIGVEKGMIPAWTTQDPVTDRAKPMAMFRVVSWLALESRQMYICGPDLWARELNHLSLEENSVGCWFGLALYFDHTRIQGLSVIGSLYTRPWLT